MKSGYLTVFSLGQGLIMIGIYYDYGPNVLKLGILSYIISILLLTGAFLLSTKPILKLVSISIVIAGFCLVPFFIVMNSKRTERIFVASLLPFYSRAILQIDATSLEKDRKKPQTITNLPEVVRPAYAWLSPDEKLVAQFFINKSRVSYLYFSDPAFPVWYFGSNKPIQLTNNWYKF